MTGDWPIGRPRNHGGAFYVPCPIVLIPFPKKYRRGIVVCR